MTLRLLCPTVTQLDPAFAIKIGDHWCTHPSSFLLFSVGKFNSLTGQKVCFNCTIGRYNPATSSDALVDCLLCVAGTFSNVRPFVLCTHLRNRTHPLQNLFLWIFEYNATNAIRRKATTKPRIARIAGTASTRTNKAPRNANNARRASTTTKWGKAPSVSVARVARVGDGATRWN